jgi:hypothetical protein
MSPGVLRTLPDIVYQAIEELWSRVAFEVTLEVNEALLGVL